MTKKEFIAALVENRKILRSDAAMIANMVFEEIRNQIIQGREVRIDGVGAFCFKYRGPRVVNNNLMGEHHEVGPSIRLKFKAFPSMQRELKRLALEMNDEQGQDQDAVR